MARPSFLPSQPGLWCVALVFLVALALVTADQAAHATSTITLHHSRHHSHHSQHEKHTQRHEQQQEQQQQQQQQQHADDLTRDANSGALPLSQQPSGSSPDSPSAASDPTIDTGSGPVAGLQQPPDASSSAPAPGADDSVTVSHARPPLAALDEVAQSALSEQRQQQTGSFMAPVTPSDIKSFCAKHKSCSLCATTSVCGWCVIFSPNPRNRTSSGSCVAGDAQGPSVAVCEKYSYKECTCPRDCSFHGTCSEDGVCICDALWESADCSVRKEGQWSSQFIVVISFSVAVFVVVAMVTVYLQHMRCFSKRKA